jgi:uncharacterized protein (DUF58 family)
MGELTAFGRAIALFVISFFLIGFLHAAPLLYLVAFFCIFILFACSFIANRMLKGLGATRDLNTDTVFSGDPLEAKVSLTQVKKRWRLMNVVDSSLNLVNDKKTTRNLSVVIEGDSGNVVAGGIKNNMISPVGDNAPLIITDTIRFSMRGHYKLGPLVVKAYDPFGIIVMEKKFDDIHDVIVYPQPLPVPDLALGAGARLRREVSSKSNAGESVDFHSIRPYVIGDDLRRVHWKSTAHANQLSVKEFEYLASGSLTVIVDMNKGIHNENDEWSTLETGVTIASSLLNHFSNNGSQISLALTRKKLIFLPAESGRRQLHRALEELALTRDDGDIPLSKVLTSGEISLSNRSTVVVITADKSPEIIEGLLYLKGRAARVILLVVDAYTEKKAISIWEKSFRFILDDEENLTEVNYSSEKLCISAISTGIPSCLLTPNQPLMAALREIRQYI